MNIGKLKYVEAGYLDTPVEYLENLSKRIGKAKIYIKRDDMTGLGLGGNKARKLNYLIKDALDKGYTAVLTYGGVQTNHGRMTVAAALKYGLKPILVLTGDKPEYASGNLILDTMMGADIYFADTKAFENLEPEEKAAKTAEFMKKCTDEIVAKYESGGDKVYLVPVGGQGVIGSAGYVQVIPEILAQMNLSDIKIDCLVAGYGSTGTFAGLVAGAKYYNAPFEIIGVPVSPTYRSAQVTADFVNEISDYYDMGFKITPDDIRIENGPADALYSGEAYNKPDALTRKYMAMLAQTEGIFTDPCYTGKVLHGVIDMVEREIIPKNKSVMMLHSGGTPAIWSKEHLDDMQSDFYKDYEKLTVFKA